MTYNLKETEKKESWDTGSKRNSREGKGRFDLLPAAALMKLAQHYEAGARLYGDRNWEKGQPISRYLDSALRHLNQLAQGYKDEPHAVSGAWNVLAIIQTLEMIDRGLLPKELNDLPSYMPKELKPVEQEPKISVENNLNSLNLEQVISEFPRGELRISLDIDDVLASTVVDVLKILEQKTGKRVEKAKIKGWNLDHMVDGTGISVKDLFGWVWSDDHWNDIQPEASNITELVNELSQIADVSIVTSASPSQVEGKAKWLEKHGIELPLVLISYGKTKEDMPFDVFIDDRPETIERAVAKGKLGILYSQPWNTEVKEGPRLIRVNNLREAMGIVKKYTGKV